MGSESVATMPASVPFTPSIQIQSESFSLYLKEILELFLVYFMTTNLTVQSVSHKSVIYFHSLEPSKVLSNVFNISVHTYIMLSNI